MAWEARRGRHYYYESLRIEGRPRKRYIGAGPAAEEYARLDAQRRQEREAQRNALHVEQARVAPADRALRAFGALADLLARSLLLLGGYHEHRGCWRRRHDRTR
jgi:hypothetical protein